MARSANASAVAALGLMAASSGRNAPFKTKKRCYMSKYNGKLNNKGRHFWRVQGELLGGTWASEAPSAYPLHKPVGATVMIWTTSHSLPGEWTAWVEYPVLVHCMTVKKHFKTQGVYMVTGCTKPDVPAVDNKDYFSS